MASDFARFLRKQYLDSLTKVSGSSDPIPTKFREIGKKLDADCTSLTTTESISLLNELNDTLADWLILTEQKMAIKRILSCSDVAQMNERFNISNKLHELERRAAGGYSSTPIWCQPNFLLDRLTFYESGPSPSRLVGFDDYEKKMVDWLSAPGEEFKAVGIYGMGGSGKTALVKQVLKQQKVRDKFKDNVIWLCLSDLTCKDEIDVKIVKYLLNHLGHDTDNLYGDLDEDEGRLKAEVERRLLGKRKYVIVFDDVWHCDKWFTEFCGKLAAPKESTGGAVILTSRMKNVAQGLVGRRSILINLKPWNRQENAFVEDVVCQSELVKDDITTKGEIIGHCHGLPLAAKMLPEERSKLRSASSSISRKKEAQIKDP